MKLSDFSVLTFDCYGTLIDWESGMVEGLRPLTDRIAEREGSAPERDAILERMPVTNRHSSSARHRSSTATFLPASIAALPKSGTYLSAGTRR